MSNDAFNEVSTVEEKPTFQETHYDEAKLNEALTALSKIEGGGKMAMDMVEGYAIAMAKYELKDVELSDHEFQDPWAIGTGIYKQFATMTAVGDLQYAFEDDGISKLSTELKFSFAAGVNSVLEDKYPDLDMKHAWQGPSNVG